MTISANKQEKHNITSTLLVQVNMISFSNHLFSFVTMYSFIALLTFAAGIFAASAEHIVYSTVPGFFLQDLNTTNASTFDYVIETLVA